MRRRNTQIDKIEARVYRIPTDQVESDGTLRWDDTTCVVVRLHSNGCAGMGYTYSHAASAMLVRDKLAPIVRGCDALSPSSVWHRCLNSVRNLGRQGLAAHAISAVDIAAWDLKARLLDLSLVGLWGRLRDRAPVYGSGGFTSYDDERLAQQLKDWVDRGIRMVKIKVGRNPRDDLRRVALCREIIGSDAELFVDANGAYHPRQALRFAQGFEEHGVSWLEEPVSSDDLPGLRFVRDRAPAGMSITAGEYGYHLHDFQRLLEFGAVDVLQADATRCLGYTGFRKAAALCEARATPLSAHTAPALHAPLGLCLQPYVHTEYFHDHVRIEDRLFGGTPRLQDGSLSPPPSGLGHGLWLLEEEAERYMQETP